MSSFLNYYLQPVTKRVLSYIKGNNNFLSKIKKIRKLPEGGILCTMDVAVFYTNLTYGKGLASLRKFLETRDNNQILNDTLAELAEKVLNNNKFEFNKKILKQKCGTTIGTKVMPPYTIIFMIDLAEEMLETFEKKSMIW